MLKAGAALSLSGRFAVQGVQAYQGLTLWAEDVNRQGGLAGPGRPRPEPVELIVHDDLSRVAEATARTEHLIDEDRVDLLFSPYGSVLTLAAAEVAERHGRTLWNHGGSSDAIEERGWRRVGTLLSPASSYLAPVLDLAVAQGRPDGRPIRTVALLHGARGTFPVAVAGGARTHAASLGLDVVLDETYPEASSDLTSLVTRIGALAPDVILGVGATEADLAFARELRRRRARAGLIALVAAPIQHFRDTLGADADGFCGPSQWEPDLRDDPDLGPTSAQFSAAFRARFGAEPDYPAAQAYAAGLIAARCVELAGSLDDDALRRAAGALEQTTFYGRFRLDTETGQQVGHEIVVVQWQAGRKSIVWPPVAAAAPLRQKRA